MRPSAVNKTASPAPPKNRPTVPKKARAVRGRKNAPGVAKDLSPLRTLSEATEYPRSYLKDEDLRAAMQCNFESIEDAIHPDRLSMVEHSPGNSSRDREPARPPVFNHGARDHRDDLEPGEVRDDAVQIKIEPKIDHRGGCVFTSTEGTVNGNFASPINPFFGSIGQSPPDRPAGAEANLIKLGDGAAELENDLAK